MVPWLEDSRREALESFRKLEPPKWRRTDLAALNVETLAHRAVKARSPPRRLLKVEGVIHMPLLDAVREHEELVRPILTRPVPNDDKWARLHHALWNDGTLLHVEKGREVAEPLSVETTHAAEGALLRDIIVLERGAKARLVLRSRGGAKGSLAMEGTDVQLGDGASLAIATLQDVHRDATLLATRRARVARDASLAWIDGQFGGGTTVTQNETRLEGAGASLRFIGAFFGSAGQHMDVTTSALHEGTNTSSKLDMKGALNEDGYSANYSIVNIGPLAKNASGHQHQETLLLSDRSRADAIPKLDVENNEVSASHGATVGQVDPEQLFYLRTRGFDELRAKRLIVEGFFEPLLREVPVEDVREELRDAILSRLR